MRHSYTQVLVDLFTSRPGEKFSGQSLSQVGGFCGWGRRVREARERLEAEGLGTIKNEQVKTKSGAKLSVYWFEFAKEQ